MEIKINPISFLNQHSFRETWSFEVNNAFLFKSVQIIPMEFILLHSRFYSIYIYHDSALQILIDRSVV